MRLIDITSRYHLLCTGLNADTKECDYKIHGHELAYREVQITVQPGKENAAAVHHKTDENSKKEFFNGIALQAAFTCRKESPEGEGYVLRLCVCKAAADSGH